MALDLALEVLGGELQSFCRVGEGVVDDSSIPVVEGLGDLPPGEEGERVLDLGPIVPEDPCDGWLALRLAVMPRYTCPGFGVEGSEVAQFVVN